MKRKDPPIVVPFYSDWRDALRACIDIYCHQYNITWTQFARKLNLTRNLLPELFIAKTRSSMRLQTLFAVVELTGRTIAFPMKKRKRGRPKQAFVLPRKSRARPRVQKPNV